MRLYSNQRPSLIYKVAFEWYEHQRPGLGYELIEEVEEGFERLSRHPHHYSATNQKYRKLRVSRFPYLIVFEIEDVRVIINAVRRISQESKHKDFRSL